MSLRREAESETGLAADDLRESWRLLAPEDRLEAFLELPRPEAEDFFLELSARDDIERVAGVSLVDDNAVLHVRLGRKLPGDLPED